MTKEELIDKLMGVYAIEEAYDSMLFLSEDYFNEACIGVSEDERAVYSYDKLVYVLCNHDNMTTEEAIEYIEYNIMRSLQYSSDDYKMPLVIYTQE